MTYAPVFPAGNDPVKRAELIQAAVYGLANETRDYIMDSIPRLASVGDTPTRGRILLTAAEAMFGDGDVRTRVTDGERPPMDKGVSFTPIDYTAFEYARTTLLLDKERRDASALGVPWYKTKMMAPVEIMRIFREIELARIVGTAANWATSTAIAVPANRWVANTSNPTANIETAIAAVEDAGGNCDTVIMTVDTLRALKQNAPFLQFQSTTIDRTIAPVYGDFNMVANILRERHGIENVLVMGARRNTSKTPGAPNIQRVAANWFWVGQLPVGNEIGYVAPSGTGELAKGSALYRLPVADWNTETERDGTLRGDVVTTTLTEAVGVMMNNLGHLITGTVS